MNAGDSTDDPPAGTHLREFWLEFVVPALAEWRRTERDPRLASIAFRELDAFTEHALRFQNPGLDKVGLERDKLCKREPAFGIARDLHDAHKHGALKRKTAIIREQQKPYRQIIGALGSAPFGSMPFGGMTILLRVKDRDGKSHLLAETVDRCVDYWRTYLLGANLLAQGEGVVPRPPRFGAHQYFGRGTTPAKGR